MSLGRFKDLCIDVASPSVMTSFWGRLLGLTSPADNPEVLVGDRPEKTIWLNRVAEPRTVSSGCIWMSTRARSRSWSEPGRPC
ncbi:hypothetical protein [Kribbella sp. NPDC051718]|uniref:hypothetical protein n=1 Tax=Kribbella sp. NPDC051718 TaxID=3155168 RepID=UPI0034466AC2